MTIQTVQGPDQTFPDKFEHKIKTFEGLRRQFTQGRSVGGRIYGYRVKPIFAPNGQRDARGLRIVIGSQPVIEPSQAAQVRRIFEAYQNGETARGIATRLATDHPSEHWTSNKIYGILRNIRYRGEWRFNQREWYRTPEGHRRYRPCHPNDVIIRQDESLRIIDEATWHAVQTRLHRIPPLHGGAPIVTSLLTGFLQCDTCQGTFGIVSKQYIGCGNTFYPHHCPNRVRFQLKMLEPLILRTIHQQTGIELSSPVLQSVPLSTLEREARQTQLSLLIQSITIGKGIPRPNGCPLCSHPVRKWTPRHLARHGLTVGPELFDQYPSFGATHMTRLTIHWQPATQITQPTILTL